MAGDGGEGHQPQNSDDAYVAKQPKGSKWGGVTPCTRGEIREAGKVIASPDWEKPSTRGMYTGAHLGLAVYRRAF